jgi:hypothetical protein
MLLASSWCLAQPCPAQPYIAYSPSSTPKDLIPAALEVYSSSAALTSETFSELSSLVVTGQPEVLAREPAYAFQSDADAGNGGRSKYWPVLFSALMPGTGEIYLGYKGRGIALITLEVAAWAGYFYYRNQGLDSRDAYESFADQYWSQSKWIDHHPLVYPENLYTPEQMDSVGQVNSGSGEWPGYIPWVSKEEDKQHFYENIGKYDWYISGWQDFDPDYYDASAEIPFMTDTALRDQYREMRKESNDQLDDANKFAYMSLGVRVFSVVETLFLARGSDSSGDAADETKNQLRLRTRAKGFDGGEIFVQYTFK